MALIEKITRTFPFFTPLLLKTVGPLKHLLWRLRLQPTLSIDPVTPDMVPQPLEGYTDKHFYLPGQTIAFHLKALLPNNQLVIQRCVADQAWEEIAVHTFHELPQSETLEEAQQGCYWSIAWQFTLPITASAGYYRTVLTNPALPHSAEIHFVVGSTASEAKVLVLAPITTWLAYNAYAGQSLYRNAINAEYVPFVSALRPNTALTYNCTLPLQHNLRIEANIYNWYAQHYKATLYPDYYLEAHSDLFSECKVVVLAYHVEYFSKKMYETLRTLVLPHRTSLVALGGNQMYWQVRWHQNFTQVECRKNGYFFKNEQERGSLWRHTQHPEAQVLGAQFSELGMGTYAPYQVLQPSHWLFKETGVKAGDLFGDKGLDNLPICGDETDKTTWSTPANTVVLAKGLNKTSTEESTTYEPGASNWDGSGGGEITLTEFSATNAVLNTGSIQSGSGLGTDPVFTQLILNFMRRYAHTSTNDTTRGETAAAPAFE